MKKRIVSAVFVIGMVYGSLWYDVVSGTGWGYNTVMMFFVVMGLREFYRMAEARGARPFKFFGIAMGAVLVYAHEIWCLQHWHDIYILSFDPLEYLLPFAVLGTMLLQLTRREIEDNRAFANIGSTLLGLAYVWYLPSFIIKMRHLNLPGSIHDWQYSGVEFVMVCILVTKVSDVGALLTGSTFGKHKLIPRLSPKKTWEGAIGGFFTSLAVISLMAYFEPTMTIFTLGWPKMLLLGGLLGVSALGGDLIESSFKRDSQTKDAGTGVPGFGGMLDVVDSLMLSGPVMYIFLIINGAGMTGTRAGS